MGQAIVLKDEKTIHTYQRPDFVNRDAGPLAPEQGHSIAYWT